MAESEASHGFPEGWRCPCLIFVALKQSQMAQRPTAQRQHGRALALPTGDGSGGAALEAPAGSCAMLQDRARGDLASKLENLSASGACRVYPLDPRWSRRAFRILAGGFLMAAASRRRPQTRRRDARRSERGINRGGRGGRDVQGRAGAGRWDGHGWPGMGEWQVRGGPGPSDDAGLSEKP